MIIVRKAITAKITTKKVELMSEKILLRMNPINNVVKKTTVAIFHIFFIITPHLKLVS